MRKNEMNALTAIDGFLFKKPNNTLGYILSRALLGTMLGLIVGCLFSLIFILFEMPAPFSKSEVEKKTLFLHLIIVILGPVFETALLVAIIELLKKLRLKQALICALSGLFLAVLHVTPTWFAPIVVFLPFVIYSCGYLVFTTRSRTYAFFVCYAIHGIDNAFTWLVRKIAFVLST